MRGIRTGGGGRIGGGILPRGDAEGGRYERWALGGAREVGGVKGGARGGG